MTTIDWRPELWRAEGELPDGSHWGAHVGLFNEWNAYVHHNGPAFDGMYPTADEAKAAVAKRVEELERKWAPLPRVRHITDPDSLETGMA